MVFDKVVPESVWQEIQSLRGNAGLDTSVFRSCKGGDLSPASVKKIIYNAAKKLETDGKLTKRTTLKSKETQLELNLDY
ncbi:MAG: hypothetical protein PUP91_32095 [Rhizonema sp. PD37]|nr:hypothetical protein [Rhizonema sp. PD37]